MRRFTAWTVAIGAAAFVGQATTVARGPDVPREARQSVDSRARPEQQRMPLVFEPNRGQADEAVEFVARPAGMLALLSADEATFVPRGANPIQMRFRGASDAARLSGAGAESSVSHYFLADERLNDVAHFRSAVADEIYAGVDLQWRRSERGRLEYTFELAAGVSADRIEFAFDGAESVRIDRDGALRIETNDASLTHSRPIAYQTRDGRDEPVEVAFDVRADRSVGFVLGPHDARLPVIIDPELEVGSFLGGNQSDRGHGTAVGSDGSLYVAGETESANFPVVNAFDSTFAGGGDDAFVARFAPNGSSLIYSTFLGGSGDDAADTMSVDAAGNAYLSGATQSFDFPTQNAVQPFSGGSWDAFASQLSADGGTLVFSTYIGGSDFESPRGIDTDSNGAVFVVGMTGSLDFPASSATQSFNAGDTDAWIMKLSAAGASVEWATYLGGFAEDRALDCVVDGNDDVFVVGNTRSSNFPVRNAYQPTFGGENDAFIAKVAGDGSQVLWATFFGGSGSDDFEGCDVGPNGDIFGGGNTASADYPTTSAVQNVFLGDEDATCVRMSNDGQTLVYSTFIGGSGEDDAESVAVDQFGGAYLTGSTDSPDFPIASLPQPKEGGNGDAFVVKLTADGRGYVYTTYIGGNEYDKGREIAVSPEGVAFVVGETDGGSFPTPGGAQQNAGGAEDLFFTRLSRVDENTPPPNTIRSFLLPKSVKITTGAGKGKVGAKIKCFFDTGPDDVDFTQAATLRLGTREFTIPALAPIKGGKSFRYTGEGLRLDVKPSKLGTSKAVLNATFSGDLAGDVELDGEFSIQFVGSGFDATGTVLLVGGAFKFGKAAGQVISPEFSLRKGKAKLPGVGRHSFKLVCAFSVDRGTTPAPLPSLRFAFGNVFNANIEPKDLQPKGKNVALTRSVAGIDAFVLTYHKERFAVRGGNIELGPGVSGPQRLLIIFGQGADVRAVEVRVVRKGSLLKY